MAPLLEALEFSESGSLLAAGGEEGAEEGQAFVGEDAAVGLGARMERRTVSVDQRCVAATGVISTPHHSAYLAPANGTGTHQAWLDGDIERTFGQIFGTKGLRSGGDGLHFGMGRDIM